MEPTLTPSTSVNQWDVGVGSIRNFVMWEFLKDSPFHSAPRPFAAGSDVCGQGGL